MDNQYLIPNHYLSMHERQTRAGRIYWLKKNKVEFCKLYLGFDISLINEHILHQIMFENRGISYFTEQGLPKWEYTDKPQILDIHRWLTQ